MIIAPGEVAQEQNAIDAANLKRRLLIDQTKRELLAHLKEYRVGVCRDGQIIMRRDVETLDGVLFVIPESEYRKLFGGLEE